jgi:hypothetical protein
VSRVRGIAAHTFLLSFQLAAVNLRKQHRWHQLRQRLAAAKDDIPPRRRRATDYRP